MYAMLILLVLIGYLVGSIPTGYWFGWYWFGIDITKQGSGNIGASNVARVLGTRFFLLIFAIDALKAYATVVATHYVTNAMVIYGFPYWYFVAFALLVGNGHSLFLRGKGGRGVATATGILMHCLPSFFTLIFMGIWALVVVLTHRPFVASLASMLMLLIILLCGWCHAHTALILVICVWIVSKHLPHLRALWIETRR